MGKLANFTFLSHTLQSQGGLGRSRKISASIWEGLGRYRKISDDLGRSRKISEDLGRSRNRSRTISEDLGRSRKPSWPQICFCFKFFAFCDVFRFVLVDKVFLLRFLNDLHSFRLIMIVLLTVSVVLDFRRAFCLCVWLSLAF